jgi:leucyl aminopeptidase
MMLKLTCSDWKKWPASAKAAGASHRSLGEGGWKGVGQTLAMFVFEEQVPAAAKADGFKGKERETFLYRPKDSVPAERVLLIGLGKKSEFTNESLRRAASKVLCGAESLGLQRLAVRIPRIAKSPATQRDEFQALAEGLYLGAYRFDRHKSPAPDAPKPVEELALLLEGSSRYAAEGIQKADVYSKATILARDLINEPPSRMNPERLADEALKLNKAPLSVTVLEKKDLEKLGMGAILGVGAGGAIPPRLVEIVYRPVKKAKKVLALVGKGITFDSGGLSLKPAQSMETMKDDMSGAAAVLGVMSALSVLKPAVEVRGYMAIAENMPGGRALKPGDVVKAFNGKTIEVLNTDAEGRLVLADALAYAASKKPDLLIDIATLTGACVVAVGHRISAVMTNTPKIYQGLRSQGARAGEKFWELPLEKDYQPDIKSKIADLQNIGKRRGEAGTIIGGLFLQEFVDGRSWAHVDIAGASWTDSDQPYCPQGGTGHPVRTLLHYIEEL